MTKRWYIVHAYSNFEKKVAESIKEQSVQKGLGDLFEQVLVPTEEIIEVRRGRKIKSERRFFPGYVLVKMELTDQAFHLIKNTPKVTGFLGSDSKPIPISDAEATASSTRWLRAWNGQRPASRSKLASRCALQMDLLLPSTDRLRKWMKSGRG